jgi:hypothetical protein
MVMQLLSAMAAAYCIARGTWLAIRVSRGGLPSATPGFRLGAIIALVIYCAGGLTALLGVPIVRFVLAAQLIWHGFSGTVTHAQSMAEGRKASELASSWEYVRGRVRPSVRDYLGAVLLSIPTHFFPACVLLAAAPASPLTPAT